MEGLNEFTLEDFMKIVDSHKILKHEPFDIPHLNTPEINNRIMEAIKSYQSHVMPDNSMNKLVDEYYDNMPFVIMAVPSDFPANLKKWRISRGYSLRHVEQQTGISNALISQMESGKVKSLAFDKVVKLCICYKIRLVIG